MAPPVVAKPDLGPELVSTLTHMKLFKICVLRESHELKQTNTGTRVINQGCPFYEVFISKKIIDCILISFLTRNVSHSLVLLRAVPQEQTKKRVKRLETELEDAKAMAEVTASTVRRLRFCTVFRHM